MKERATIQELMRLGLAIADRRITGSDVKVGDDRKLGACAAGMTFLGYWRRNGFNTRQRALQYLRLSYESWKLLGGDLRIRMTQMIRPQHVPHDASSYEFRCKHGLPLKGDELMPEWKNATGMESKVGGHGLYDVIATLNDAFNWSVPKIIRYLDALEEEGYPLAVKVFDSAEEWEQEMKTKEGISPPIGGQVCFEFEPLFLEEANKALAKMMSHTCGVSAPCLAEHAMGGDDTEEVAEEAAPSGDSVPEPDTVEVTVGT